MYKIIKKISNVYGDFLPNNLGLFIRLSDKNHNLNLQLLSDEFCEVFTFLEEKNLGFHIKGDVLIYNSSKDKKTYGVNLKNFQKIYSIDEILYDLFVKTDSIFGEYYYNISEIDNNYIYDLLSGEVNKIFEDKKIEGFICAINNDFIITKKETYILFCYDKSSLNMHWQLNINAIFNTETDSEIKQIKIYNDAIIIASNKGISSIDIGTGSINWVTKTYAITIEIVENTGYVCTNSALYKINLDTGIISDYDGWKYGALPDIRYKEKNYTAFGYEVVFHEGLLWYRVFASGESFIIAINPHDGYYEWVHHLEGADKIDSIKFYENRMYLLDNSGVLFVYEKHIK